jgi:hypothetical protein
MSATDDIGVAADRAAPLSAAMLVMDVADTIGHDPALADDPEALRAVYRRQGIELPGEVAAEGVVAYRDRRFVYRAPKSGLKAMLARLYVWRRRWLPVTWAITLMLVIGLGGYLLLYKPYRDAQLANARLELTQTLPAEMDALYNTIFEETKVQQAATEAAGLRARGKAAAVRGDRAGAEAAIADLMAIRDTLRTEYRLTVIDRAGTKWGFWTFPEDNNQETNYYIVIEAHDADGNMLSLPIRNEPTGKVETVSIWGLRVPEGIYRAVEADKTDDGAIEHNLVGVKQFGFLDPDYVVDVLGGTVTRW